MSIALKIFFVAPWLRQTVHTLITEVT